LALGRKENNSRSFYGLDVKDTYVRHTSSFAAQDQEPMDIDPETKVLESIPIIFVEWAPK
jgi:hypothetical protein